MGFLQPFLKVLKSLPEGSLSQLEFFIGGEPELSLKIRIDPRSWQDISVKGSRIQGYTFSFSQPSWLLDG